MHIQALALTDCLGFSQRHKENKIVTLAIGNNTVSDGLGASRSAARHTSEGALPLVPCRGAGNEWGPSFLC